MGRGRVVVVVAVLVAALVGPATAAPAEPRAEAERRPAHLVVLADADAAAPAAEAAPHVIGEAVGAVLGPVLGRLATPVATRALLGPTFDAAVRGFVVTDASPALLAALRAHPDVDVVEADAPVTAAATPTGVDRVDADRHPRFGIGSGTDLDVDVAVIDTGVARLPDLRVVASWDCRRGCRPGGSDDDGHGTHVAGIVAARDDGDGPVGIAPGARVWSLKVLGGVDREGRTADLVAALDQVVQHADEIEVANISLGGIGRSTTVDRAVAAVRDAGVTVVVAAGNGSTDASRQLPANSPGAVVVSAIVDSDGRPGSLGDDDCGTDDALAPWSNHGAVVDLAAPGGCILSLGRDGRGAIMSGTSAAAPHVAGAAAQYVVQQGLARSPQRADRVLAGLVGDWSTPQDGRCGFTGGVSDEPLLLVVPCEPTSAAAPDAPPAPTPAEPRAPSRAERPADAPVLEVATVALRSSRSALGGRSIASTVTIARDGQRADGVDVTWELRGRDGRVHDVVTRTTGRDGTVSDQATGLPAGCYRVVVTAVSAPGHRWAAGTPANERCV